MDRLALHAHLIDVRLHLWNAAHLDEALNAYPFKLHDHP